jgi:hypothetical protein
VAAWPAPRRGANLPTPGPPNSSWCATVVTALRKVRSDYNVPPGRVVDATVVAAPGVPPHVYAQEAGLIGALTRTTLAVAESAPPGAAAQEVLAGERRWWSRSPGSSTWEGTRQAGQGVGRPRAASSPPARAARQPGVHRTALPPRWSTPSATRSGPGPSGTRQLAAKLDALGAS